MTAEQTSPAGRFWRDDAGDWYSWNPRFAERLSPVYTTAAAACRLIEEGVPLALPEDCTPETLAHIARSTFGYDRPPVRISPRQARELGEIARTLRDHHGALLLETDYMGWEESAVDGILRALETGDSDSTPSLPRVE